MSLTSFAQKNRTVSSAHISILQRTVVFGRLFINRANNNGPNMEPWSTPTDTEPDTDTELSILIPNIHNLTECLPVLGL